VAVIKALEACRNDLSTTLVIFTDSKYTIDCMRKWLKKWKKNGWTNSSGNDVANQDLIKKLDSLMQERKKGGAHCHLEHLPAHNNKHGNEQADLMAKRAAQNLPVPSYPDSIILYVNYVNYDDDSDSSDDDYY